MKRSDILQILEEALEKHTNISSSCCNLGINTESLSAVLGELEKAGMLPPRTKLKGLDLQDNAWEPEESDTENEQDEN